MRKIAILIVALAALAVGAMVLRSGAAKPTWPSRPVRVIVPMSTGGALDLTARLFAERLSGRWQQPVVVDNRPGADSVTGISTFVATKDDHTLLFSHASPFTLSPSTGTPTSYDPKRDIVPISAATSPTIVIAASTSLPVSSLEELVRLVRENPGKYFWSGVAGLVDTLFTAFLKIEQLEMTQVAYREVSMALQDLGGGRLHVWLAAMPSVGPQVQAGKARLLAVASSARSPAAPDIPTVAEAGYPGLTVDGTFGLYGWRGMPDSLRQKIAADVQAVAGDEALVARLAAMGQVARGSTPEELAQALDRQRTQVRTILELLSPKQD